MIYSLFVRLTLSMQASSATDRTNFQAYFPPKCHISIFNCYIWICNEKYIQMSTNKPSISPVVVEIAPRILRKYYQNCNFPALT